MKLCLFVLIALTGIAMTIATTFQEYNETSDILYNRRRTFFEAKESCDKEGMIMIYPNSKSEIADFFDFLKSTNGGVAEYDDKPLWVAAPNYPDSDNNCMMLNNEEIVPVKCSEELYSICLS